MHEIEPTFDPALRAANQALSGRKRREVSRIASIELRFTDARSGAWEVHHQDAKKCRLLSSSARWSGCNPLTSPCRGEGPLDERLHIHVGVRRSMAQLVFRNVPQLQELEGSVAISVHAPLTPETRGLVGAAELARLPRRAFVVNASRAGLVDTDALLRALANGHLGGAALDVLDVEPPTREAPAPSAPRLIVNPHAGWYSPEAEEAALRRAIESVLDVLEDREPRGAINRL